jgi:hypothetical protein
MYSDQIVFNQVCVCVCVCVHVRVRVYTYIYHYVYLLSTALCTSEDPLHVCSPCQAQNQLEVGSKQMGVTRGTG